MKSARCVRSWVPQEQLRADARREVAEHVYSALYQLLDIEAGQLRLPL